MPFDSTSSRAAVTRAPFADADVALVVLGHALRMQGYAFAPVTSATRRRFRQRRGVDAVAGSVRDILGWGMPFARDGAFAEIADHLEAAGALIAVCRGDDDGGDIDLVRSAVLITTIEGELIVHGHDRCFDPDAARCRRLLQRRVDRAGRVLDVVGGDGGAIGLGLASRAERVVLADDPDTARFARINAALAGVEIDMDGEDDVGSFDVIVGNVGDVDDADGAIGVIGEALPRLVAGGRLYVAARARIVDGVDTFLARLGPALGSCTWRYEEVEPDIIVDDDDTDAERVAAVLLEVDAPRLCVVAIDDDFAWPEGDEM